jgi:acyl-CoA reductase-like NAD-dependent aldehyde dehydrogenase
MEETITSQSIATQSSNISTLHEKQLLFINGEYKPSSSGSTFPVKNPMTGETIYECSSACIDDYSTAIDAAHTAFKTWSKTPPSIRRLIFLKAADILDTYLEKDAPEILSAEVSAVKSWVIINIKATCGILRETAGLVTHIKGEIVPADRPGTTIMVERQAVGVVYAISPWNAPVS